MIENSCDERNTERFYFEKKGFVGYMYHSVLCQSRIERRGDDEGLVRKGTKGKPFFKKEETTSHGGPK